MSELHRTAMEGMPSGGAAAPGAPVELPVSAGSQAHVRQTLDRARVAVREARARSTRGRSLLARAHALAGMSDAIVQESVALRAQLRASLTAYVRRLHADGVPPERMVVLVKTTVREAAPPELDVYDARELMEDAVRWSVEAYYDAA